MSQICPTQTGAVAGRRLVPPITLPSAIAGHGATSVAVDAADPLEVNALLLVAGPRHCLLVSFDLLYVGATLARELLTELAKRHGFAESDVFLFASHTHFAPPTDPTLPDLGPFDAAYARRVREAVLDLVKELIHQMPAQFRLEVRRGLLSHSVNRRRPRMAPSYTRTWGLSFARVTFAPYPRGARDDTASVITLSDAVSRTPIAVIWHYACHPVGHSPSQVTSADFPGFARESLRHIHGERLPVLFVQGFCGDVRPNIEPKSDLRWGQRLIGLSREVIAGTPTMQCTEAAWCKWVKSLADEVARIATSSPEIVEENMGFASTSAELPLHELFEGTLRVETMLIRGLRLGHVLEIVAFGAEPSAGWQQRLQADIGQSSSIRLYAGYCGDVFGYLPLPEQVDEGGYEVAYFQQAFGMKGRFRKMVLLNRVSSAVKCVSTALSIGSVS